MTWDGGYLIKMTLEDMGGGWYVGPWLMSFKAHNGMVLSSIYCGGRFLIVKCGQKIALLAETSIRICI